ncbi:MAG: RagB/SusD family nutrient uptake outer membrane protein [Tidjanibacter sp.]|nr:RagB/SusD family nutrient uptake outer membrane protein [Tidjanibacter sp.]
MKKILFILSLAALGLVSCEMDHFRTDTMTSEQIKADPASAVYTTDGNYALFKDEGTYKAVYASGNSYVRHYMQMSEFRGDNACLSGGTTDPLYNEFCYSDNGTQKNIQIMWWTAYKIIYGANSNIESIDENASAEAAHMKGENYFMRAIAHFHLVNLFAKPLSCGEGNLGVVLRTSTDCSVTTRATVGQVYAQVVEDLKEAARLMKGGKRRGDNGYISYETAMGLLSRVYLYMGQNDLVISTINEMLTGDPENKGNIASKLDNDVNAVFTKARSSKEVLWCVAHTLNDDPKRSGIGSMYYTADAIGSENSWCEIYWSDPLLEIMERNPEDKRLAAFRHYFAPTGVEGAVSIYWPYANIDPETGELASNWRADENVNNAVLADDGVNYKFNYRTLHNPTRQETTDDKGKVKVTWQYAKLDYVTEMVVEDGIKKYYITGYEAPNVKTRVYVCPQLVGTDKKGFRNSYPVIMMSKFSNQDNSATLSSPIMLRWGEIVLNRAEAYAKLGQTADALADLNVIRNRAGIPTMDAAKMAECGHADVLEAVLEERRMELCFEGHRSYDVWRNQGKMDRRFGGVHPWEVIDYTDDRIPYQIPQDEIDTSRIEQN